jgi:hypothetical protein
METARPVVHFHYRVSAKHDDRNANVEALPFTVAGYDRQLPGNAQCKASAVA